MAKHEGLLLKIDSKGNISGYMQENDNKIPIEDTTIKDELISFSEEDFEEYSELQNEIRKVYRNYPKESEERFAEKEVYNQFTSRKRSFNYSRLTEGR